MALRRRRRKITKRRSRLSKNTELFPLNRANVSQAVTSSIRCPLLGIFSIKLATILYNIITPELIIPQACLYPSLLITYCT